MCLYCVANPVDIHSVHCSLNWKIWLSKTKQVAYSIVFKTVFSNGRENGRWWNTVDSGCLVSVFSVKFFQELPTLLPTHLKSISLFESGDDCHRSRNCSSSKTKMPACFILGIWLPHLNGTPVNGKISLRKGGRWGEAGVKQEYPLPCYHVMGLLTPQTWFNAVLIVAALTKLSPLTQEETKAQTDLATCHTTLGALCRAQSQTRANSGRATRCQSLDSLFPENLASGDVNSANWS